MKNRQYMTILIALLVALLVGASAALAQDGLPDRIKLARDISVEHDTGLLVLSYPEGWIAEEDFGAITLANEQAVLDLLDSANGDILPTSGQIAGNISLVTPADFDLFTLHAESSALDLLDTFIESLISDSTVDIQMDRPEALTLGSRAAAAVDGVVMINENRSQVHILAIQWDDSFALFIFVGDVTAFEDEIDAIALSFEFVRSGPPDISEPPAPSEPGAYAGVYQGRTEDGAFILGDPEAPITIIEFADFMCPHCQNYESTVQAFIEEMVVTGQARFEYRMLPTQTLSPLVARVSECAGTQYAGGFWPVHAELFRLASSGQVTQDLARTIANHFDLDHAALLACVDTAQQVEIDTDYAVLMGVSGTPAIRVRYGDSPAQAISEQYARGGVPLDVLRSVVQAAQQGEGF